jgi:hypothetical protein
MTRRFGLALLTTALMLFGCQTSQTPAPAAAATPAAHPKSQFRNLQIFPPTIPREELIAAMRNFARSLGTRCDACHAPSAADPQKLDFALDTKPEKTAARIMIRMVMRINDDYVSKVPREPTEEPARVGCWTCHRGKMQPELPPPPPPEPQH